LSKCFLCFVFFGIGLLVFEFLLPGFDVLLHREGCLLKIVIQQIVAELAAYLPAIEHVDRNPGLFLHIVGHLCNGADHVHAIDDLAKNYVLPV